MNAAAAGEVICLERGSVFTAATGLVVTNTNGTAAAPIVVCSSSGTTCSTGGGANAQLNIAGGTGISFRTGVKHIVLRDLDFLGNGAGTAIEFQHGVQAPSHHITVEGGLCTNWDRCWESNPWINSTAPTNISMGTCAKPWTVRHATGFAGGGYGCFQDSVLAMDMADTGGNGMFSHNIYFSTGPWATGEVSGVVIECSRFTDSGLQGTTSIGTHLKISGHVADITVRDSVFDDDDCNTYAIDVGTSNDNLAEDYASIKVYRNVFHTECAQEISCEACAGSEIYNNIFYRYPEKQNNSKPFIAFGDGLAGAARFGNNRVYNNTFVDLTGSSTDPALIRFGAAQLDNNMVFNNIFYSTGAAVTVAGLACERLGGVGGPDFDNNFVYTPNQTSPVMLSCSAGTGNSTAFNVSPGLADAPNGNFAITASSAVHGKGRTVGAPAMDFTGAARPSPPSIGAFDAP